MNTASNNLRKNNDDEIVIDLLPILQAIKKKLLWIVAAAVVMGFLAGMFTFVFVTPMYQTSFRVYINNRLDGGDKTSVTSADLTAARSLATTYAEIIQGRTVLTDAAATVGIYNDYSSLTDLVEVVTKTNTEIITVNVQAETPEVAVAFANSIIQVAEGQISTIVDGSSMRVIDDPYMPDGIHSPSYVKNTVIGAFLGMLVVIAVIVLKEILDTRVRDEETLEQRFGIAILGSIPNYDLAGKASNNYSYSQP